MHHRSGRRRQVTRLCVPHIRGPRISQRGHDPGTLPRRKGRLCTAHLSISNKKSLTSPAQHRSTLNARVRARSTCATRGISSADCTAFDDGFNAGLLFHLCASLPCKLVDGSRAALLGEGGGKGVTHGRLTEDTRLMYYGENERKLWTRQGSTVVYERLLASVKR